MSFTDIFYVTLCITILLLGVVYWFWTQTQYLQRKLNTLESIVYEMKTAFNSLATINAKYTPVPETEQGQGQGQGQESEIETEDVSDFTLHTQLIEREDSIAAFDEDLTTHVASDSSNESPDLFEHSNKIVAFPGDDGESPLLNDDGDSSDLQPGGGADVKEIIAPDNNNVLDNMTLKELRRIGEQKGIPNVKQLKKYELIPAIRQIVSRPIGITEATINLQ